MKMADVHGILYEPCILVAGYEAIRYYAWNRRPKPIRLHIQWTSQQAIVSVPTYVRESAEERYCPR
jgi:hypothetical protein